MHFLLDLCTARKNTHNSLFSADLQSFPPRYASTHVLFFSDVMSARFIQMFSLCATAALSEYEGKQKLYLNGPEGTRESPPIPEVRESWGLKCVMGKRDMTCPG